MNADRRVLVISYYYPPYGSVGATRVSKMTRYLADHGWQATVLTVAGDDRPAEVDIEIPASNIHRVAQQFDVMRGPRTLLGRKSVEGRRFSTHRRWKSSALWHVGMVYRNLVCLPDPQIGWLRPAQREAMRLVNDVRPHVLLSSSFPNTSHLIGARVAASSGVPWVAELRDLWTDNHNFRRVEPLRSVERWMEERVLRRANALVTVSEVWAHHLAQRFGRPVDVVPNGFDPADYPPRAVRTDGRFTLVYTGMLYHGKQNPAPLLRAIGAMASAREITPATFQLQLVGHYLGPMLQLAESMRLLDFVSADPPVPHREALRRQVDATALLFLDWADGTSTGWYSAKIYEYLGARRPILSVGPRDSVVAKLLADTGAGVAAPTADEITGVLRQWIAEFASTNTVASGSNPATLAAFQRQAAARKMAALLDRVHAESGGRR